MTRQQRFRSTLAAVTACALLPLAYSMSHQPARRPTPPVIASARPTHRDQPGTAMSLQVMLAPYRLPAAVSREVVLPAASGLLIVGGLTASGASTGVTSLDPVTGATRTAGRLAEATLDAAGFALGGRAFVLGGAASGGRTIQAFTPGTQAAVVGWLSPARSDSEGVSEGRFGYVVGGYDGTAADPQVLATTDGQHFRVAARLPVPVRDAGAAAMAGLIWVFGGQAATGATDVIQRIDPVTGAAAVVGHLPQPVRGAAVIILDGRIYVAGGATADGTSRTVSRFDPATFRVTAAGRLPVPVGYAAAVSSGGVGYLIGGEDDARRMATVTAFRLVPALATPPPTPISAVATSAGASVAAESPSWSEPNRCGPRQTDTA